MFPENKDILFDDPIIKPASVLHARLIGSRIRIFPAVLGKARNTATPLPGAVVSGPVKRKASYFVDCPTVWICLLCSCGWIQVLHFGGNTADLRRLAGDVGGVIITSKLDRNIYFIQS